MVKQKEDKKTKSLFDEEVPNKTPTVLASEILRLMRERERPELLFPVIGNAPALRFCAAWSGYPLDPRWPTGEAPQGENLAWDWLWGKVSNLDLDGLAMRANIPPADVENVFELCRAARAIFPDGSVSQVIVEILRNSVQVALCASPDDSDPQ